MGARYTGWDSNPGYIKRITQMAGPKFLPHTKVGDAQYTASPIQANPYRVVVYRRLLTNGALVKLETESPVPPASKA